MLQESGREAAELRRQVTSPNGTTMAGLQVFEQADFHHLLHEVITSATVRSAEMGEQQKANRRGATA
jgi:pyrroline-5-carboxylate reductase